MERDKHVAVVTDSGTSMRFDGPEARELGVTVVPLEFNSLNTANMFHTLMPT